MRCPFPGCKKDARPGGKWCGDDHKVRGFKLKRAKGAQLPRERKRTHDAAAKRTAREQGVIASDLRVSWDRAVDVLAQRLPDLFEPGELSYADAADMAVEMLRPALPERLRGHV